MSLSKVHLKFIKFKHICNMCLTCWFGLCLLYKIKCDIIIEIYTQSL